MMVPEGKKAPTGETKREITNRNELEVVFDFSVGTGKILETFAETGKEM